MAKPPTSYEPFTDRGPAWRGGDLSKVHPAGADAEPAAGTRRVARVLLISDMLLVRAGLHHVLDSPGIVLVGEIGACDEARAIAARERPDVIVIDMDLLSKALTCIDGVLAAAPDSRVIVLADGTRPADHHVLIEVGAAGVVLKSEPPETLLKAIDKVHGGEMWLDRAHMSDVLKRMARRRHTEDVEATKIATLTRREREIITLVGQGLKNGPIGQALCVSEATVRNHLTSILDKLGLSDRFELAVYAFRQGLVQYPDTEERRRSISAWEAPSNSNERRRLG